MKLTFAKVGWILCLAGLGVLTVSAINHKKHTGLSELDVRVADLGDGDHFLTEADVHNEVMLMLGGELPTEFASAGVDKIEKGMKSNPFVKDVEVYVNSDGEMGVKVEQRQPVARVMGTSQGYYLDKDGIVIPESSSFTARLPVVTGKVPMDSEQDNVVSPELMELITAINSDKFYQALIEQVHMEKGSATLVPKTGSAVIKFGALENIDIKLKNLKTFYREIYSRKGFDGYSSIDLSIDGQIICKDNKKTN